MLPLLAPALTATGSLAGGDWTDFAYPFRAFTEGVFRDTGRLPLWNPLIFSGMPHLASQIVMVLYPTELVALFLPLSPPMFYALDMILHLFLAAALMRWWLKRLGCSEGGAFTGGLLYALGGHCITLVAAGHPHWVRCLAWMPLLFACLEGFPGGSCAAARGVGAAAASGAAAGAVMSLSILGAAMHFVVIAVPVCVVWILCTGSAGARDRAAQLAAFVAVLLVLGAVLWVPGFEYYLQSVRRSPGAGFAEQWSLSLWELPAFLVPGIWGTPGAYWGPHLFRASGDYPGLLCVALAGVALAARLRAEARWAVLAAAALVLALGPATPVGAALGVVPVFSGLRVPLRWLSFLHIALCVLAARGWDEAVSRRRGRIAAAGLAALGVACAVAVAAAPRVAARVERLPFSAGHLREGRLAAADLGTGVGVAARDGLVRSAVAAASLACLSAAPGPVWWRAGVAWAAASADLLTAAAPYFQYGDAREASKPDAVATAILGRLKPDAGRVATDEYFGLPNRRMPLGIEHTWGYHGLPLARYAKLHEAAVETGSLAMLGTLSVRFVVTGVRPPAGWTPAAVIEVASGQYAWLMPNPAALPRAWLAAEVVPVRNTEEAIAIMRRPGWMASAVPVERAGGWDAPRGSGRARGRNEITFSRGVDELDASVELAHGGLIVFSEVWYPAWKAFVDGRRVPVMRAYAALRAASVPAGTHRVRMLYDSWTLKIGLWMSLLGWTVVAGVWRGWPGRGRRAE